MAALYRRRVLRCQWNREMERRTMTNRAFDPDLAAMHLNDLLNDREAQAGPGYRLGRAASDPPEALEDMLDLVRGDAQAGVGHADECKPAVRTGRKGHSPAVRRVLDRVVDQVCHDLDEPVAVAGDDGQSRIEIRLELAHDGPDAPGPAHHVSHPPSNASHRHP